MKHPRQAKEQLRGEARKIIAVDQSPASHAFAVQRRWLRHAASHDARVSSATQAPSDWLAVRLSPPLSPVVCRLDPCWLHVASSNVACQTVVAAARISSLHRRFCTNIQDGRQSARKRRKTSQPCLRVAAEHEIARFRLITGSSFHSHYTTVDIHNDWTKWPGHFSSSPFIHMRTFQHPLSYYSRMSKRQECDRRAGKRGHKGVQDDDLYHVLVYATDTSTI